jgi:hypothetical protein
MIDRATLPDARQYAVQYELLRSQVIGTAVGVSRENTGGQARGIGLALLLSQGMPGWLKAVESVFRGSSGSRTVGCAATKRQEDSTGCAAPVWLSCVQRHEVTTLLASLVLSTRPLARQSLREEYRSW